MKVFLFLLMWEAGFSLHIRRGIGDVSAGANSAVGGLFTGPAINTPAPSDSAGILTTPSPYLTYSPIWSDEFTVGWTPPTNAFVYNMEKVSKLAVDRIDPSFFVLATASPTFTVLQPR